MPVALTVPAPEGDGAIIVYVNGPLPKFCPLKDMVPLLPFIQVTPVETIVKLGVE